MHGVTHGPDVGTVARGSREIAVHEGGSAFQRPVLPASGGRPEGDGSWAPGVFWGELSLTRGKVLHVFL